MYSITNKQYFYSTNVFHKAICCWFSSLFIIQWTYCFFCVKHTSNASCANIARVHLLLTVTLDCGQSRLFTVFAGRWTFFFCSLSFRIFSVERSGCENVENSESIHELCEIIREREIKRKIESCEWKSVTPTHREAENQAGEIRQRKGISCYGPIYSSATAKIICYYYLFRMRWAIVTIIRNGFIHYDGVNGVPAPSHGILNEMWTPVSIVLHAQHMICTLKRQYTTITKSSHPLKWLIPWGTRAQNTNAINKSHLLKN